MPLLSGARAEYILVRIKLGRLNELRALCINIGQPSLSPKTGSPE